MKKSILFFLALCSLLLSTVIFSHPGHGLDDNAAHSMVHSEWIVGAVLLLVSGVFMFLKYAKK
jgi:hypothetical protein